MIFASNVHEFCIGRMVTQIGILRIGAAVDLRAARLRANELTVAWPGDYVVFNKNTGRVLAKVSRPNDKWRTTTRELRSEEPHTLSKEVP